MRGSRVPIQKSNLIKVRFEFTYYSQFKSASISIIIEGTSDEDLGIRSAKSSKIDHAYKIAYLKCTLNLNTNS